MQEFSDDDVHRWHQRQVVDEFFRRSTKTLGSIVHEITATVLQRFPKGRRLDGEDLKALFASIDSLVTEGMVAVAARRDERPPTRARPKSEAYEAMYVVAAWEESQASMRNMAFRLHSLRIFGTRKKVVLSARPLPLLFSRHAAARFYDRATRPEDAAATLGSYVYEWSLVPALAEDSLLAAGGARLALPGPSGGLLLGAFDQTAAVPQGLSVTFDQYGRRMEEIPASPFEPGLYCVNTYVSGTVLRPEQKDYRRCLGMWRRACGPSYEAALRERTWPGRELGEDGPAMDEVVEDALGTLVQHPEALRAAGNLVPDVAELPARRLQPSPKSNNSQNFTHSV